MLNWFRERRRKKILQAPFPLEWRKIVTRGVQHYSYLDEQEQQRLRQLIQIFIAEKQFEGCGGLQINDEIRVVIAAQACLLVLGLPPSQYLQLESVIVYPTTVTIPPSKQSIFSQGGMIVPDGQAILGQAFLRGPVILVWDTVQQNARHPEQGHNVVYHEFAHVLDLRDGAADGTPILQNSTLYRAWVETCSREYASLKDKTLKGQKSLLDYYGSINEAEFFAVATELFFDRPLRMQKELSELYKVLSEYYRQDTAAREQRYKSTSRTFSS